MPTNIYQRTAMAAAIAACFPDYGLAAPVARVDFAAGSVSAIGANGQARALTRGSEIEVGETVSTQQGRAQLRFVDGAYMSLQPQTEFKVEEFQYSGKSDPSDSVVMNLLKGGLRTITGLIGRTNRNAYRLKTDVATIGIRGTEYSVKYTNSIEVFVADGAISVDNQAGSFTIPGGSGALISNDQTPPQQTDQKPVLPPESPVYEQQQQVTQQVPPPPNPFVTTTASILTGTRQLNMAFANYDTCGDACFNPVTFLDSTGTLDASGALVSFDDGSVGVTTSGTAIVQSAGNDGIIAWGRWFDGTTGGTGELSNYNLTGSPLHYVVGIPATNIPPSGQATYEMIGHTPPSSFESVTLNSSMLKINFTSPFGEFHANFTVNGSTVQTPTSGVGFCVSGGQLFGGGGMCGPFCSQSISLQGVLVGEGAVRAGMGYELSTTVGPAHGVIAYKQTSLIP